MALLLGTACSCPTTPSTVTLVVIPAAAAVVTGKTQQFCGSGSSSTPTWTAPGGTFTTSSNCILVTAGSVPGKYTIAAAASGLTATATMTVIPQ